jgi:N-acetylneuraminate synthase
MSNKPFIIAEMSGNHNQSLERALEIVEAAAASGVDALKIQTYTAETMTLDCDGSDFVISDKNSLWDGEKLYDLYVKAATPYEWHKPIFDKCSELGIVGFSTPFDLSSVDFLESLNCSIYKIASFENGDIPLLKRVAQTKKPVIISLGMIGLEEIKEAVDTLKNNGCEDLTILKCTSSYPASVENSNLLTILDLKKHFPDCKVGLSDHTLGIGASIASVALGAEVIEKHFTLCRADGGVDSAFSMESMEMKQLVEECNNAYKALGQISYDLSESEKKSLKFRRSLYVVKDIKKGEKFTSENIRSIRPGYGLHSRYYEEILGKMANLDLNYGEPLKKEYFE